MTPERRSPWKSGADLLSDYDGDEPPDEYEPKKEDLAEAEKLLRSRGIAPDEKTIRRMAQELRMTKFDLIATMRRRANRDWGPDRFAPRYPTLPDAFPAKAAQTRGALSFEELVKLWAAENQPPDKTREKWDATFRGFAKAIGHDDAKRVTVEDGRKWKQARLADGKALKTVSDGIGVCRSVFNWGITNGLLQGPNPFANMAPKVPKRGLSARDGYTDEEAC